MSTAMYEDDRDGWALALFMDVSVCARIVNPFHRYAAVL